MTRTISLLLLPLLAAGAVATPAPPIVEHGTVMHRSTIERRQMKVKDAFSKSISNNLPKFFQWAADNLSYLLRAQDLPLKRQSLKPELNHAAKRVSLRFGPWSLYGTNVRFPMIGGCADRTGNPPQVDPPHGSEEHSHNQDAEGTAA
jgi:hypothetical protein